MIKSFILNLKICLLFVCIFFPDILAADEIHTWTDSAGRVHYSNNNQQGSKPATLPKIKRENIDKRIESIKLSTPKSCLKHGGVDCSKGPDQDGSVVCLDGYLESALPFQFECLAVKLSYRMKFDPTNSNQLSISVRNLSSVEGFNLAGTVKHLKSKKDFKLEGPDKIDPFGIAEYTVIFADEISSEKDINVNLTCTNCQAVTVEK
jgi:hypothetical protein